MSALAVTAVCVGAGAVIGGVAFWLIPGVSLFLGVLVGGAIGAFVGIKSS